jgi:hypothetical protein
MPAEQAEKVRAHEASVEETKLKLADLKKSRGRGKAKIAMLESKLAKLQKGAPHRPTAMAVEEAKKIQDCEICIRGSVRNRGPAVPRGVLQVATIGDAPTFPQDFSGRRELAEWIVSPRNPLTSRVYVNRVWHYLFGVGLVRTLDNFGSTGETPSHPELLDFLAARFIDDGWSTKRLVRELVLSHAYRMSTQDNRMCAAVDPENRLLWRMNRVRLDAESLRDAMLMVSGRLDLTMGGPNMHVKSLDQLRDGDQSTEYEYVFKDARRSVYTPAFRNRLHELFEVFDFADPSSSVARRSVTTVAPQALLMLNGEFVMEQARSAAQRALVLENRTDDELIVQAFRETLGRNPSEEETAIARAAVSSNSLRAVTGQGADVRLARWEELYQALFGCIDFRYLN